MIRLKDLEGEEVVIPEEMEEVYRSARRIAKAIIKDVSSCPEGTFCRQGECMIRGDEDHTEYVWRVTNRCGEKVLNFQKVHSDIALRGKGMMGLIFDLIEPFCLERGYTVQVTDLGNQTLARHLGLKRGYQLYSTLPSQPRGRSLNELDPDLSEIRDVDLKNFFASLGKKKMMASFAEKAPPPPPPSTGRWWTGYLF